MSPWRHVKSKKKPPVSSGWHRSRPAPSAPGAIAVCACSAGRVVGAILIVVVAIVVSSGGSTPTVVKPNSPAAKKAQSSVNTLLAGIPQQGNTLGSPSAKVTVTEYGDLVCPVCKTFALGAENQLIQNEVKSGKVKIVYKALETASQTANNSMFVPSQTAALAAGNQKKAWNYIELFYHEQGDETTSYVTDNYLGGLAKQMPGLNFNQWSSDRSRLDLQLAGQRRRSRRRRGRL